MKTLYKKYLGELFLILASLSYSLEWYFVRDLSDNGFSGIDITFGRIFLSALIILIFFLIFNRKYLDIKNIKKKDIFLMSSFGILALISNLCYNVAIINTSVANVITLIYLSVFWGFLFGILFFKEMFSIKKLGYIFLAFVGIIFVVTKDLKVLSFNFGIGEILAIVISFIAAIAVIISKYLIHIKAFLRVLISFFIVSFGVIVYLLILNGPEYFLKYIQPEFLISAGLLAFTAGVLGKGLKSLGINYVSASNALVVMLLEPIFHIITAYFIAGEKVSIINMFGIGIVLIMVVLISRKK